MKKSRSLLTIIGLLLMYGLMNVAKAETTTTTITTIQTSSNLMTASYLETGINLGTPGGVNLAVGYWTNPLGLRVTGMSGSNISAYQINLGYKLADDTNSSMAMALIGGSSRITNSTTLLSTSWDYFGIAYDWVWGNWYTSELGLTWGTGSYSSPQLAFQIGIIYRHVKTDN